MEARRRQEAPAELMCNSTDPQPHSPLMLYTEHQRLTIALCPPQAMAASHWHAQVELNIPFDGEIDYRIHDRTLRIPQGHIALFWACTPTASSIRGAVAAWPCSACPCICFSPGRWIRSCSATLPTAEC